LSGQFNVTLGQKLTEHLQKWMEVEKYIHQPPQPVAWEAGTECEVAASMLDIFHKLPPAAKEFLETQEGKAGEAHRPGIVVLTIGLEEALQQLPGVVVPSKMWSPYRAPLTRFLNRYPEESVAYFLDSTHRLSKPEYFTRLLDIIRNPLGKPLLNALAGSVDKIIAVLTSASDIPEAQGRMCFVDAGSDPPP
jgi:transformation/transcription domain-associated protein